jgi:phage baseplate assembly protein W
MDRARNLLLPFRRDRQRDFAWGTDVDLLRAKVLHIVLSDGEMPWRPELGAGLGALRHHRNDAVLEELVRIRVRDGLRRWAPGIEVAELRVSRVDASLVVRLRVRDAARGTDATLEART